MRRLVVLAFVLLAAACSSSKSVDFGERQALSIATASGADNFSVEVARTPTQLWTGLRHRRHMDADQGMLFDLGTKQVAYFTMTDTIIPLDMVFIDFDGHIAKIEANTVPGNPGPYTSDVPVFGVLELNAGTCARLGIKVGDTVHQTLFGT